MATINSNQQKITPFLWFDTNAEEAVNFYTGIFNNSKIGTISRYSENAPMPAGTVMVAAFVIEGQNFMAINGGPHFKFSPAISFVISCDSQHEIDHYWDKLSAGGSTQQCGWLQDKFGVSWQVVPTILGQLMSGGDAKKSANTMQALWKMNKLIIADLQTAYNNG